MHDGMVMANKGFQDKLFKMYTGQTLKGVSCNYRTILSYVEIEWEMPNAR